MFDEFESLNEDVATSRQRRDAEVKPADKEKCGRHGEGKREFNCCVGDKFDHEYSKQMKDIKKQCAMKLRSNNCEYLLKN